MIASSSASSTPSCRCRCAQQRSSSTRAAAVSLITKAKCIRPMPSCGCCGIYLRIPRLPMLSAMLLSRVTLIAAAVAAMPLGCTGIHRSSRRCVGISGGGGGGGGGEQRNHTLCHRKYAVLLRTVCSQDLAKPFIQLRRP